MGVPANFGKIKKIVVGTYQFCIKLQCKFNKYKYIIK